MRKKADTVKKQTSGYGTYVFLAIMLIILVLLVFSVYRLRRNISESYNYQGKNGLFLIDKGKIFNVDIYSIHAFSNGVEYIYPFRNHPESLEDLPMEADLVNKLNSPNGTKILYVTRDTNLGKLTGNYDVVAAATFEQILSAGKAGLYRISIVNAYTEYKKEFKNAEITCNDADDETAVVYLKLGEENKIYSDKYGCVVIQGKDAEGLIQAGEKFGYYLLGVF